MSQAMEMQLSRALLLWWASSTEESQIQGWDYKYHLPSDRLIPAVLRAGEIRFTIQKILNEPHSAVLAAKYIPAPSRRFERLRS